MTRLQAFTLYTFFQLLINFIGGERALIVMMHGRPPVSHLWPLSHCLSKVDISDPHTFLAIKRGVLQYAWIKPLLAISTIAMKATGTYQEGYIGLTSGYLWSGIVYNVSITVSLYALALFWVCMSEDLQPFRPMPKFLCIKGIIFASYWQGFFLSILVWLGAIPDMSSGYSADNLAAAIQDALICFEMPFFALGHWYAFSWHDYADETISDARMPVKFAVRDAFGPRDLIEDAKETFYGTQYEYRYFDAEDNVIAHEQSASRQARMQEGMRYERGGRGKYWLPEPGKANAKTPLLAQMVGSNARTMSPSGGGTDSSAPKRNGAARYGALHELEETNLDPEEERLYTSARALEFGDWNYPVINTHYATARDRTRTTPSIITGSTNRNLLQPTAANKQRRKSKIQEIQSRAHRGSQHRASSSSSHSKPKGLLPKAANLIRGKSNTSTSSSSSADSQLVDLVVEDTEAEQIERVRARKEGGPAWNEQEQKHFVKTYGAAQEVVGEGFNPDAPEGASDEGIHDPGMPFTVGEDEEEAILDEDEEGGDRDELEHGQPWERRTYDGDAEGGKGKGKGKETEYGSFNDERDAWGKKDDEDDQR